MAKLETSIPGLTVRSPKVGHIIVRHLPGSSTWGFSRHLLLSSSLVGGSRLSSGDNRFGSDYFEGEGVVKDAISAEANLASCGIIIYDTHFAVASACNASNNGWSKKSRYERYTAGSVFVVIG